ncbi:flavodoxin family protein [Halobacillus mangrovi]|uniref:8-demethyl-8-aminoriboflavin-5'-phosphate (AFP) synthase RosB n=1 Tax=Halobacillus mangrovi TaxID=402384 RepID=A0A1W5ZZ20_9BACI|nr:NAD(P)H-dependent oxidoreductase [Halobacillus mangrovi]ARI78467.1 8-demethyl-8-aminoriboflavin-5'-phosphate (AFP) synthase RosB [Halobacillus mangrovi]
MSQVKALFLNASLKNSEEQSNTEALWREVEKIYDQEEIVHESVRLADYYIPYGIDKDLGDGDEWPHIFEKIKDADIVVLGTPLWLGEKSSIATKALERMYGSSSETNEKGQAVFYNKVAGVVITGNEDGAKNAAESILYRMSHIGFVIPPNVDAYWVGEAGPGPSYIEANGIQNDFTKTHIEMLAYNTMHLAKIFKEQPIPAVGNTQ